MNDKGIQTDLWTQPLTKAEARELHIQTLYTLWLELGGFKRALSPERRKKVNARLNSYTVEQLELVLRTAFADPGTLGQNRTRTPYTDLVNIFRNDARVDMYLEMAERGGDRRTVNLVPRDDAGRAERF